MASYNQFYSVSTHHNSEARLSFVRAVGQRLTDTAQLFIAAGGGWWNDDTLAAPAPRGSD